MAVAVAGGNKRHSGRGRRRRNRSVISDINITPFVDVMLVLLIVFMVAAPLLVLGVPINLPKTQAKPLPAVEKPISVTVSVAGELYIQDVEVPFDQLTVKIDAIGANKETRRIYVRGDGEVEYSEILRVVAALSTAGYQRIGLVSDPEQNRPQ